MTEPTSQLEPAINKANTDQLEIGPLFICGRQHSGNTVTACVFERVANCLSVNVEGLFFEQRSLIDRIKDPTERAKRLVDLLKFEDEELADRTKHWLIDWQNKTPDASALDCYCQAMQFATLDSGKEFWVRRATSYIFYAQEILTLMPKARVLYLLRNPHDVCASKKRRNSKRDRYLGWVISWNRGMRIALDLEKKFPDRFLMKRYEDMVSMPEQVFKEIFNFMGLPFSEDYLNVPHVNRSEKEYTRTSEKRGFNASRLYYYKEVLKPVEIQVVDMLTWKEPMNEYYPDMPHRDDVISLSTRILALLTVAWSPFPFAWRQFRVLFEDDMLWRLKRLFRRVALVLGGSSR
ncbi:MAG: sulfotransferase [Planctomycetes bacterium]|nr:sulfotransferase [Planctomycetota bacterium]